MQTETKTTITDVQEVFNALERWIKQRPRLDKANYGLAPGQTPDRKQWMDSWRAYQSEIRSITKDGTRARQALKEARLRAHQDPKPEMLADAFRAFSGRLEWRGQFHDPPLLYTTGQYWPTEYRKAAASVLETYIAGWRQAEARENPQTFTYSTMADVIEANQSIGNHWFDKDTMRFFNTKIESRLIAGKRFITSDKGPDNVRRYTIREAQPDGTIDTIGEFQQFATLAKAKANVLMNRDEAA